MGGFPKPYFWRHVLVPKRKCEVHWWGIPVELRLGGRHCGQRLQGGGKPSARPVRSGFWPQQHQILKGTNTKPQKKIGRSHQKFGGKVCEMARCRKSKWRHILVAPPGVSCRCFTHEECAMITVCKAFDTFTVPEFEPGTEEVWDIHWRHPYFLDQLK